MHLSFYAIGFYALLSRKRNSRPGLALPVAGELIIFLARVYRAYAGTCSGSSHDKKPGFSGPGFDQEGCKFPFNELNF